MNRCGEDVTVQVYVMLQFVNLTLFVLQIHFHFITNIWIVFAIILFEGLLGGAAYVNSFYQISKQVRDNSRSRRLVGVYCTVCQHTQRHI